MSPRLVLTFPHPLGSRGIGSTAWHQVVALARAGAEVVAVVPSVARPLPADVQVRVVRTLGPVRPRMVGRERAYDWHDRVAARVIRRLRPHIVHAWSRAVLHSAAAAAKVDALVVREAPSPYTRRAVADAAAAWQRAGIQLPQGHFHALDERALRTEDAEFKAADLIATGSTYAASTFDGVGVARRVAVVPYGFDPEEIEPSAREPLTPPTVCFIGRVEPAKGIHDALAAFVSADLPTGAVFRIYGDLAPAVRHGLEGVLDTPGVVYCGPRPAAQALADADVLLLPSYTEGSALVTYEALGAGVVPIVSQASGAPFSDGDLGRVCPTGAVDALAEALRELLGNPDLLGQYRQRIADHRAEWTWDAMGPRLLDAYSAVPKTAERHN